MSPLRDFSEFIDDGIVRKQRVDISRARSLIEEAEKRKTFLNEMITKIPITDENANYYVENCYDTLMGLIRAKLLADGYNSSGAYAHEAEVSYLKELRFSDSDVRFVNDLRYFRNGILYYGRQLDSDYANKVLKLFKRMYPRMRKLLEDIVP